MLGAGECAALVAEQLAVQHAVAETTTVECYECAVAPALFVELARDHGMEPAQMALAFCASRPFRGSVILGATTMEQLRTDLGAADVTLGEDVMEAIAAIRRANPQPL